MQRTKVVLFNFILVPQIILVSFIQTGDAFSKSSATISTDGENAVVENNEVKAYSNTGANTSPNGSDSITTGDSKAVSEVRYNSAPDKVEGKLEVEANGEKKVLNVDKPGDYKLEITATAQAKIKTESSEATDSIIESLFKGILDFIFGLFRK